MKLDYDETDSLVCDILTFCLMPIIFLFMVCFTLLLIPAWIVEKLLGIHEKD